MRRERGNPPACPQHPDSTVWRDGTYGRPDRRRQRYRCLPPDGSPPHRFSAATLAGAPTPRHFSYSAAEIASVLVGVGRGMSYRAAARLVPRSPAPDGNSVADWVELFAPVIHARSAPSGWPRTVELGRLSFRARALDPRGRPLPDEVPAFEVLAAVGPRPDAPPEVVALRAVPGSWSGAQPFWEQLLGSLEGMPAEIVCEPDPDLLRAIEAVWHDSDGRSPVVFLDHRRLRRSLLQLLRGEGVSPAEALYEAAERAFDGPRAWRTFVRSPRPRRLRGLERWLRSYGERVVWQLAHARGRVTDTGELAATLASLHEHLSGRRGTLRNRERTNRLLMLAQLELNGRADAERYAQILQEELLASGGRPAPRRRIVDTGSPSLRP